MVVEAIIGSGPSYLRKRGFIHLNAVLPTKNGRMLNFILGRGSVKKVHLVMRAVDYEGDEVVAVYDSKKKAEEKRDELQLVRPWRDVNYEVHPWEVQ